MTLFILGSFIQIGKHSTKSPLSEKDIDTVETC